MQSPRRRPRRRPTRKEKGKMKMPEYGTDTGAFIAAGVTPKRFVRSEDGPPEERSASPKRAIKSAEQKLRRSTNQKNPVMRFKYNEYNVHHYAYMTKVVKVREPESYTEAAKGANWRATMEEGMHGGKQDLRPG